MATLTKTKKATAKSIGKNKSHSLLKAFGAAKEKNFEMEPKSRAEIWKR